MNFLADSELMKMAKAESSDDGMMEVDSKLNITIQLNNQSINCRRSANHHQLEIFESEQANSSASSWNTLSKGVNPNRKSLWKVMG